MAIFKVLESKKSYIFRKLTLGTPQVGTTHGWNFFTRGKKSVYHFQGYYHHSFHYRQIFPNQLKPTVRTEKDKDS